MWFPIVSLISFGLLLLVYGQVLPKYNQHLGAPTTPLVFDGKPSPEGSIWLSVHRDGNAILATTEDHQIFRWQRNTGTVNDLNLLRVFLEERIRSLSFSAILAKRIFLSQTMVVLAVDKSLVYADVRPIIYLLSQLGFGRYAFEAKKPNT